MQVQGITLVHSLYCSKPVLKGNYGSNNLTNLTLNGKTKAKKKPLKSKAEKVTF